MSPISLGAVLGGVVAFIVTDAIVALLWVAGGALVGAGVGWLLRRFGAEARTYAHAVELQEDATRDELYKEAQRLDIPGRSSMNRDELATSVAKHMAEDVDAEAS